MNCMKCGVEIPETQVFCDHCLEVMEQYPIKPGTHIHLPKQNLNADSPRKPAKKKRTPSAEEQVSSLRLKVLRLRLAVVTENLGFRDLYAALHTVHLSDPPFFI